MAFRTLEGLNVRGKRVLLRVDLNVPMADGKVTDNTRIVRQAPTIRELSDKGARVIILAHFERPGGKVVPSMSLKPVVPAVAEVIGRKVTFAEDCVGPVAESAVASLKDGGVLILENTRFHKGEEKNDPDFAKQLAALGDIYVNDAFSAAHRAHASTEGVAKFLPAYAGRAMESELSHLEKALANPTRPLMAVVGGAKVSSKIDLLENLVGKVDTLVIGGAMANTFLAAQGLGVGKSLHEPDYLETARKVTKMAADKGCALVLPGDVVVAGEFRAGAPHRTVPVSAIGPGDMALDVGPATIAAFKKSLAASKTLVWNGPLGAFETAPFDAGTVAAAQAVAEATKAGHLLSVAGGGDTVAALAHARVENDMTYVSTAGGAFLEWLEGKKLPGVEALKKH
jgi:phosphoglycerate kinase